ncbi:MAG: PIN domain-containing protein [Chitinispirillales bacterium]|jgi:PIN domain nuclease of toxin-antitoxin system|nr:PIN domain-containing protein [Chitinispirillales bacterium]
MRSERYYLDSNIVYFIAAEKKYELTAEVSDIIDEPGFFKYVPSKCVEELIYLQQSGKIKVKNWKSAEDIVGYIEDVLSYEIVYVNKSHLLKLAELPLFPDHKDQTDRIIIAQAIADKIPLISSDEKFNDYKRSKLGFIFNER